MTLSVTVELRCSGCFPPLRRYIPADLTARQRMTWHAALEADCRRTRGCRCRTHELVAYQPTQEAPR